MYHIATTVHTENHKNTSAAPYRITKNLKFKILICATEKKRSLNSVTRLYNIYLNIFFPMYEPN